METFAIILSCWLLTYLLHSTAFYGLAKLLVKFPAFAHNRAKEILWKVALCGGLLTASIQVFTGAGVFTSNFSAQNEVFTNAAMAEKPQNLAEINTEKLPENQEVSDDMATSDLSNPTASNPIGNENVARELSIFEIAVIAWLAIVGLLVVRLFIQKHLFFKAILPREKVKDENLLFTLFKLCSWGGIEQKIVLTSSEKLYSPLAMGKGEICLPARTFTELSPEQQQSMLAHELAHVVRKDYLWLKFFNFLETVLFFQPLNRLMRIELQEVTEQRCDEWAIRSTGNAKPLADTLVKVAEWITEPNALRFASGMALHQSSLRQRIMNILKNQYLTQKELNRMKVIVILILLFVFTTFVLPGKTWLSISFAHNSKFANLFHHQEIGIGDDSNGEKEMPPHSLPPLEEVEEMELPEPPEPPTPLAAVDLPDVLAHTPVAAADTLRFGSNFMLITKGNGNFEIYKDGKLIEEEDYEKYKDDFIVRNDRSVEIVAKNGVVVSTGKEEEFPKAWAWSSPRVITIPSFPPARVWSDAFGDTWSRGFGYGFFNDDEGYSHHWEEKGDRIEMDFDKDDNLIRLKINGKKIEKTDFPKHQKLIDKAKENIEKDKSRSKRYQDQMLDYKATIRDAMRKSEEEIQKAQRELENLQRGLQEMANENQLSARKLEEKAREHERKARENTDRILEELIKDGLIEGKDARYEVRMNKRGLFIDDEKQSDTLFKKYKNLLKDLMGINIENGGNFMLSN
ncbi:M56 family metallopeptidase [Thermoflexibacter ruber]|uniref:Signal transducer regulating beta-lactamase production, contains metallopeptidase domain n=1 Tax=Thermoflexibacter ruber TaxID=1003 RepID=A0A1I2EVD5_9BACT|nr:M56 family metallopeptidase [Thermoflexibacter ruber]SFE96759.1 Signal transducer regulating beta-lactamase production, contains metallopeptidase domain [Thermoflexibacter ruber]